MVQALMEMIEYDGNGLENDSPFAFRAILRLRGGELPVS